MYRNVTGTDRDVTMDRTGIAIVSSRDPIVRNPHSASGARCFPAIVLACAGVCSAEGAFTVGAGLYDQADTVDLGLSPASGTETSTVYAATASTDKYVNGVALIGFKGHLYCQWQSSAVHEDSSDTKVVYSRSVDGKT